MWSYMSSQVLSPVALTLQLRKWRLDLRKLSVFSGVRIRNYWLQCKRGARSVVTANKENRHLQEAQVSPHCTGKRVGKRPNDRLLKLKWMKVKRLLFTVHQTPAKQTALQTVEYATTDSAQNSANSFDVGKCF